MPKKAGIAIIAVGAALILSALLLLLYNRHEDARAGQQAGQLLTDIEAIIDARKESPHSAAMPDGDEKPDDSAAAPDMTRDISPDAPSNTPVDAMIDSQMPVIMHGGYEYIGYLEIPALQLRLPVMSEWDYNRLEIAPCRQFGSSRTNDLVIAAHNYASHFGRLKDLSPGDTVTFTDADGTQSIYCIEKFETLNAYEVETVQNSGYDLVLYTCTKNGKAREAVFCSDISGLDAFCGEDDMSL